MLSPYRMQPNTTNKRSNKVSNTKFENNSHRDPDVIKPDKSENKLKGAGKVEINERYLD